MGDFFGVSDAFTVQIKWPEIPVGVVDVVADGSDRSFKVVEDSAWIWFLVRSRKNRSIMFSHEAEVGVRRRWSALFVATILPAAEFHAASTPQLLHSLVFWFWVSNTHDKPSSR